MVPHILLGDQQAPCAGSRARTCPVEGHPCLSSVTVDAVLEALEQLAPVVVGTGPPPAVGARA